MFKLSYSMVVILRKMLRRPGKRKWNRRSLNSKSDLRMHVKSHMKEKLEEKKPPISMPFKGKIIPKSRKTRIGRTRE